jgi:hypothetical protein
MDVDDYVTFSSLCIASVLATVFDDNVFPLMLSSVDVIYCTYEQICKNLQTSLDPGQG